ncbi:MAG TPA: hypothetical protein VNM92_09040 [Thermoanaerobaculia bacterium]|nr:hypothetical protein [Thermoanaerobaculia bacterium]
MSIHLFLAVSLASLIASAPETIVLRSGHRMDLEGSMTVREGQAIFTSANQRLYSIAIEEIDLPATEKLAAERKDSVTRRTSEASARRRIKVTDAERERLLREIEANHEGKPAPARDLQRLRELTAESSSVTVSERGDERYWRDRARSFSEAVTRSKEDLQLLLDRQQQLEDQILGFLSLGYNARQFSYQAGQLQLTRDSLAAARLEVTRANRENDRFRDDARREGILPGWLR